MPAADIARHARYTAPAMATAPPLVQLSDIHLTFGGTPLLEGAELAVAAGERVCLVGRNGSGKSTLLKIAAGLIEPDRGERFVQPGATVRYLPQEPDLAGYATTLAYVEVGPRPDATIRIRRAICCSSWGSAATEDPARCRAASCAAPRWPTCWRRRPTSCCSTSRPTTSTCRPSNGWRRELAAQRCALVLISHDRRFLETLSQHHRLARPRQDRGASTSAFASSRPGATSSWPRRRWPSTSSTARSCARSTGCATASRRGASATCAAWPTCRRCARPAAPIAAPPARRPWRRGEADLSGKLVVEAKGIAKSFGDRPIVADFSHRILRGDRLGIVGPNGSGKTTLVSLLTGALAPDSGTVRLGANLEMVTLDQGRESLDPNWTLSRGADRRPRRHRHDRRRQASTWSPT